MKIQEYDPRIVLLPEEVALTFDESLSLEDFESCFRSHTSVCGIVDDVDVENEEFIVELSNSIEAHLPFKESVYQDFIELSYETNYGEIIPSHYSESLIGRKISVYITSFTEDRIEVSRIPSLKNAYEAILEGIKDQSSIFQCYVLSCSRRSAFVDMGGGVLGLIPVKNLSCLMYTDLQYWVQAGDIFSAKIDSFDKENMKFYLSRKAYSLSEISPDSFERGDMITVAVGQPVPSCDGYFVEITPGIAGIMDSKRVLLEGEIALGTISKIIPDDRVLCGFRFRLDDSLIR